MSDTLSHNKILGFNRSYWEHLPRDIVLTLLIAYTIISLFQFLYDLNMSSIGRLGALNWCKVENLSI
jgi:hypothetical protein